MKKVHNPYVYCPKCQSDMQPGAQGYNSCSSTTCSFVQYENPTPVVAAVVEYGDRQVVLGHNKLWPKEWYALITGFVEMYEDPAYTVIREVKEEIGLDGEIISFIGHYTFKRMNQLIIAYHVKATGEIILDDEIDDVKIVPFDKVKYWPAGTGYALRDLLLSLGYSPVEAAFTK